MSPERIAEIRELFHQAWHTGHGQEHGAAVTELLEEVERQAEQRRQSPATVEQPRPQHIEGARSVHDQLIESIRQRKALGLERYGTILQAGATGRDSLTDALQEALDLAAYLQCLVEERAQEQARIAELEERCRALELELQGHRESAEDRRAARARWNDVVDGLCDDLGGGS